MTEDTLENPPTLAYKAKQKQSAEITADSQPMLLQGYRASALDHGFLADDDDDAGSGDVEAAAIGFEVETNFSVFGEADVAVDDRAANAGVAADVDVVVDDGICDFASSC